MSDDGPQCLLPGCSKPATYEPRPLGAGPGGPVRGALCAEHGAARSPAPAGDGETGVT
jgi:hypothetical protein